MQAREIICRDRSRSRLETRNRLSAGGIALHVFTALPRFVFNRYIELLFELWIAREFDFHRPSVHVQSQFCAICDSLVIAETLGASNARKYEKGGGKIREMAPRLSPRIVSYRIFINLDVSHRGYSSSRRP